VARKTGGAKALKGDAVVAQSSPRAPVADSRHLWIAAGLVLATLAVYAQVAGHQFVGLDDDRYVRDNPVVARGLTPRGIIWAFTTFYQANWHPLTWLSHMLDVQTFGLWAGGHLLMNAAIHAANAVLVFFFLRRITGAVWRSGIVAALFALHPLHVESVAWAAERKDTLAAFFGLLALIAYARYVAREAKFAWVALWLALGLMAKPMLVTWPFVFLLLDYWPLRRVQWDSAGGVSGFARGWWPLIGEKLVLFALVGASMVVTYFAQSYGGAVRALEESPLALRLSNISVAYAKYLGATFVPNDLAVYYPFALGGIPAWQVAGALVLLAAVSVFVLWQARARPYLIVGWLWFVGTLVPVIGLVQVGGQTMADRYHYLPSIGLFTALVFGVAELATRARVGRAVIAAVAGVILLACAFLTAKQTAYWRNSETLFTRTLAVTPPNLLIRYNLGHALLQQRRFDEALVHLAEALRIDPNDFGSLVNSGMALAALNRPPKRLATSSARSGCSRRKAKPTRSSRSRSWRRARRPRAIWSSAVPPSSRRTTPTRAPMSASRCCISVGSARLNPSCVKRCGSIRATPKATTTSGSHCSAAAARARASSTSPPRSS
jgi:tetratricopeptide (TPR) repeat protein